MKRSHITRKIVRVWRKPPPLNVASNNVLSHWNFPHRDSIEFGSGSSTETPSLLWAVAFPLAWLSRLYILGDASKVVIVRQPEDTEWVRINATRVEASELSWRKPAVKIAWFWPVWGSLWARYGERSKSAISYHTAQTSTPLSSSTSSFFSFFSYSAFSPHPLSPHSLSPHSPSSSPCFCLLLIHDPDW